MSRVSNGRYKRSRPPEGTTVGVLVGPISVADGRTVGVLVWVGVAAETEVDVGVDVGRLVLIVIPACWKMPSISLVREKPSSDWIRSSMGQGQRG